MRFATDQKFWRRGQWAASTSLLIFMLGSGSLATAQQTVVRNLCSSAPVAPTPTPTAPIAVAPAPAPNHIPKLRLAPTSVMVEPIEIAGIDHCVRPSPIGVRYSPALTAKVRRQYEDTLTYAKGATNEKVVSNVILNVSVDITTSPAISNYRDRDRNDGPVFISLTGGIINNNRFPLSSVNIRCHYRDALGVTQSFEYPFRYTLGAGGHIPFQDKMINALPPHSLVNEISCKVETAEIWQNTDVIQYLNAPLNPDLRASTPGS